MSGAELSGWSGLSLWRKLVYWVFAIFLGLVFASPINAMLFSIWEPLPLLGLVAAGFFAWRVYLYIRADLDYVDSDQYAQLNPDAPPAPRHWP